MPCSGLLLQRCWDLAASPTTNERRFPSTSAAGGGFPALAADGGVYLCTTIDVLAPPEL